MVTPMTTLKVTLAETRAAIDRARENERRRNLDRANERLTRMKRRDQMSCGQRRAHDHIDKGFSKLENPPFAALAEAVKRRAA